jgi:ribosomal protein S18 acetylase RimI-like enzyme
MTDPIIVSLPWDSKFFGVSIATCRLGHEDLEQVREEAKAHGVDCLYLFVPDARPPAVAAAVRAGGRLVDLRLRMALRGRLSMPAGATCAGADETEHLRPFARRLATASRFSADPRFSRARVASMYEIWLERCLAEGVIVIPDDETGAFVGARTSVNSASIDLVFVDRQLRGKGLASKLVRAAVAQSGVEAATVVTQAWNIAAQRAYQDAGFRAASLEAILHLWLDSDAAS